MFVFRAVACLLGVLGSVGIVCAQQPKMARRVSVEDMLWDFVIPFLWLGGLLLGLAGIIALVKVWYQRTQEADLTAQELLAEFREMRDEGELSDAEFKSIRGRLSPQVKQQAEKAKPHPTEADRPHSQAEGEWVPDADDGPEDEDETDG